MYITIIYRLPCMQCMQEKLQISSTCTSLLKAVSSGQLASTCEALNSSSRQACAVGACSTPVLLFQDIIISFQGLLRRRQLGPVVLDCVLHQPLMAVKCTEAHHSALLCTLLVDILAGWRLLAHVQDRATSNDGGFVRACKGFVNSGMLPE